MQISDLAGTPVLGRHKSDGGSGETQTFPPLHFIDFFKSEPVHEIADSGGNDDGLVGGDSPEAPPVEMVEVGVSNENQIDIRQVMVG
jgi:hypothetical protein